MIKICITRAVQPPFIISHISVAPLKRIVDCKSARPG